LNISKIKFTKAYKYPSDLLDLYIIDNFLDDYMCQNIIQLIKKNNQSSNITNDDEPDKYYRTSNTSHLDITNPIVKQLDKNICNYIGISNDRSEQTQGQYYKIGNEFKKHTDWFDPTNYKEWYTYGEDMGQRTWTFMIYLNDVPKGGSTYFHEIDFNIHPIKGRAVVWNNIYPDGNVNKNTLHSGQPVLEGEKYIITKWFRSRGKLNTPFLLLE
jgi:prolyl 4-hydroxylase